MADTTYAVVDKSKKAKNINRESDKTLYTAVDMTKKKKSHNITTAVTTLSDAGPPVYYDTVALEETAFERADPRGPESDYSIITAENMTHSGSNHLGEVVANLTAGVRATEKAGKNMAAVGHNTSSKNSSHHKLFIACIIVSLTIAFLITLICLVVLFYEIATIKANQGSMEHRVNNLQQTFHQDLGQSNILAEITGKLSDFQARNDEIHMQLNASMELDRDHFAFRFAASCAALPPSSPPGYYWIGASADSAQQVYCTTSCAGVSGGWRRMVYLNMTDCSQLCPSSLKLHNNSGQCTCGKSRNQCNPVYYRVPQEYSQVCGKIIAQLVGSTEGFRKDSPRTIDQNYLDGISLTHGSSPRQHIWSFAAESQNRCCTTEPLVVPSEEYFCDGVRDNNNIAWNDDDDEVCAVNNPPWFHKQLAEPTVDDIEVRLCVSYPDEDIRIQSLELYIQ